MELGDGRPGDPPLPRELQDALREWSALAEAMVRTGGGGPQERALLRRRGLLIASRLADVLGRPVDFVDPVTGEVERVPVGGTNPLPRLHPDRLGPTPWATGLPVAAFVAVVVALADVVLSRAFAQAFGLWWMPANLLVALGLAPSLLLLRRVPFWRWPALGTGAGLVAAWVVLLMGMLD